MNEIKREYSISIKFICSTVKINFNWKIHKEKMDRIKERSSRKNIKIGRVK